jgi:hypothetical protein
MKAFVMGLILMSTTGAIAGDICEKIVVDCATELEVIQMEAGISSAMDVLTIHANNLQEENLEKAERGQISHEEAQNNLEEIQKIRQCANMLGLRRIL